MSFTKVTLTGDKDLIKEGFEKVNDLIDDLASTSSGLGASQIGIEDSADNLSATNVEDALAEIYTDTESTRALSELLNENDATTTGLTWGYKAGTIRFDNTITTVAAGTISLTNNATNYIEVQSDGTVSRNTTGFTSGRIPLREVVCASGVQTTSTDKRSFFTSQVFPVPVTQGGTGVETFTDHGILLGSGTSDITVTTAPTNGQLLIGKTGSDPSLATLTGTANQITVTNGAGTITLSIPDTATVTFSNTGLHILDSNASHDLIIKPGSDLSADRELTITTGDSARTITLSGDISVTANSTINQDVSTTASPTFANITDSVLTPSKPVFSDANRKLTSTGTVPVDQGGTGQTTYTNGQLLIGNTTGSTLAKSTLTQGDGITITNGTGTISLAHTAHTGDVTGSTALTIGSAKVTQSMLKTSSGTVSKAAGESGLLTLPGGAYGFFPQIYSSSDSLSTASCDIQILNPTNTSILGTTPVTRIYIINGDADTTVYAKQTYVTSSGEVFWIFILRDKITKKIISIYESPDHPCFGNGGNPLLMPHPFNADYNLDKHEIIVINPDEEQLSEMRSKCEVDDETLPDREMGLIIAEDYEIDENSNPLWTDKEVTVGLPKGRDWKREPDGTKVIPIKKKIPKPDYIKVKSLKKK